MTGWRNYVCDVWMGLAFCVPAARKLWECRAMADQSEGADDLIKARPAGAAYIRAPTIIGALRHAWNRIEDEIFRI